MAWPMPRPSSAARLADYAITSCAAGHDRHQLKKCVVRQPARYGARPSLRPQKQPDRPRIAIIATTVVMRLSVFIRCSIRGANQRTGNGCNDGRKSTAGLYVESLILLKALVCKAVGNSMTDRTIISVDKPN